MPLTSFVFLGESINKLWPVLWALRREGVFIPERTQHFLLNKRFGMIYHALASTA